MDKEYERGFKDGLKLKIGEELQPMIVQVLECISEAIKGLIPRMIDIMEITANLDANDWIPCSERMPCSREGIIFTVDRGHPFVCVGYRLSDERIGVQRWFDKLSSLNFSDYDVKAWMPMPDAYEPPEEGDDSACD